MKHHLIAIGCITVLTACGGSGSIGSGGSAQSIGSGGSSTGSGSFGTRRQEQETVVPVKPVDSRAFVPVLKSAKLDRTKGGSILRVEGQMDRVGYYDLELVLVEDGSASTLTYEVRAAAPRIGYGVTTERSRDVDVATFVNDSFVPSARTIVVKGLRNTLTLRR